MRVHFSRILSTAAVISIKLCFAKTSLCIIGLIHSAVMYCTEGGVIVEAC